MTIREEDVRGRLLFAIPKKGRIHEKSMEIINRIGLKFQRSHRTDVAICTNMNVALVFLGASGIALYVGQGRADMGITGEDIIAEKGVSSDVQIRTKLGYGKCRLCVQAPVDQNITTVNKLIGKRIVTSFPNMAKQCFDELSANLRVQDQDKDNPPLSDAATTINFVSGSVEAACCLGLADGIVDLVETGETMRAAGLEVVHTIMETETVLVSNPKSEYNDLLNMLQKRIEGVIMAQQHMMIEYNVKKSYLEKCLTLTPGSTSPTIMPLQNDEWVAVKAMINKKKHLQIMDELELIGAESILVYEFKNCR